MYFENKIYVGENITCQVDMEDNSFFLYVLVILKLRALECIIFWRTVDTEGKITKFYHSIVDLFCAISLQREK